MTPTICGHERDVMIAQLRCLTSAPNDFLRASADAWKVLDVPTFDARKHEFARAFDAVHDPSKLAEIMAEALRERGIEAQIRDNLGMPKDVELIPLPNKWCPNSTPAIGISSRRPRVEIDLTMPQARAALLRILQLPEGATAEDAMKALANNGAPFAVDAWPNEDER